MRLSNPCPASKHCICTVLLKGNLTQQPQLSERRKHFQQARNHPFLRGQISAFFDRYSEPGFDLWRGGSAKSNVTYDNLWKDAWGKDWRPEFSTP